MHRCGRNSRSGEGATVEPHYGVDHVRNDSGDPRLAVVSSMHASLFLEIMHHDVEGLLYLSDGAVKVNKALVDVR